MGELEDRSGLSEDAVNGFFSDLGLGTTEDRARFAFKYPGVSDQTSPDRVYVIGLTGTSAPLSLEESR